MATSKAHESFGLDRENIFSLVNKTKEEIRAIIDCLKEEGATPVFYRPDDWTLHLHRTNLVDTLKSGSLFVGGRGTLWSIFSESMFNRPGREEIITL